MASLISSALGDTSKPLCPLITRSASPPTSVAITALPLAMASMHDNDVPSLDTVGISVMSAAW